MMGEFVNWQGYVKRFVVTALALLLLLVSPAFTDTVRAEEQDLLTAAQTFVKTISDARAAFDEFAQEAEAFLGQESGTIRQALKELPNDLQRLSAETDLTAREQLQTEVAAKQNAVATFIQSFDEWTTKANATEKQYNTTLDTARSEFKKYFDQSQKALKAGADKKVDNLKLTLKQTAKAISALNDNASRIISGGAPFVLGSFDEQLTALDKSFDTVSQLVSSFAN